MQSRIPGPSLTPPLHSFEPFPNSHLIFKIFHLIRQIIFKSTTLFPTPSTFIQVTISSHPEHSSILHIGWSTLTSFSTLEPGRFFFQNYCHPLTWLCTVSVSYFFSHVAFCKLHIAALFPPAKLFIVPHMTLNQLSDLSLISLSLRSLSRLE